MLSGVLLMSAAPTLSQCRYSDRALSWRRYADFVRLEMTFDRGGSLTRPFISWPETECHLRILDFGSINNDLKEIKG